MELNEYIIYEIMKLDSDNSTSLFNSLRVFGDIKVDLLHDENNVIFYQVKISDIIKNKLTTDDMIYLRNGGWELSENKEYIVKFL